MNGNPEEIWNEKLQSPFLLLNQLPLQNLALDNLANPLCASFLSQKYHQLNLLVHQRDIVDHRLI
jgi:hypothetical protein